MVVGKPKLEPHVSSQLRTFASKIHPPLPRTPRQNRQLQRMLDASFRRQLDKQFPSPSTAPPPTQHSDPQSSTRTRGSTPAAATDNLLTSILSHPFFNVPPASSRRESSDPNKHASREPRASLTSERPFKKKPLDRLVDSMTSGTASVVTLHACLSEDLRKTMGLSDADAVEHMKKSGLGAVVLSWFAAADLATRHRAFGSATTIAGVTPYLCSCGAQDTVLTWLGDLLREFQVKDSRNEPAALRVRAKFGNVLVALMRSEIRYGSGIDSALRLFLRICSDQHIAGAAGDSQPTSQVSWVYNAARYLTGCIVTLHTKTGASAASSEPFHRFFCLVSQFDDHYIYQCLLALYHPARPTPEFALQFINNASPDDHEPDQKLNSPVLRMCIRAAEVCMQQDRNADAQRFLTFVKRIQMRDTVQPREKARTQQAPPHDVMLDLLAPASG